VVEQEGGMVNKFIGDGFLAFFDPKVMVDLPEVAAARAARRLMIELPLVLSPQRLRPGLALGSGNVVVGEIGSKDRCEFSVVGDAVNRTARLEGLNASLGSVCLVTAEIAALLPAEFACVNRGEHALKGLAGPIDVMELLSTAAPATAAH
jgi:adenylate cyclase